MVAATTTHLETPLGNHRAEGNGGGASQGGAKRSIRCGGGSVPPNLGTYS